MAENPKLEITISGEAGPAGATAGPAQPHQPILPAEPRPFVEPQTRSSVNAENVARFASERADILEKIGALRESRNKAKAAGPEAEAFDSETSRYEMARLKQDLQTVNDVLRALGATAEQITPHIRKADDSLKSDTYRLRPEPGPRKASLPPVDEPETYKLGAAPKRYNPEAEDTKYRERVDAIRDAANRERMEREARAAEEEKQRRAYTRRRGERFQKYRQFRADRVAKRFGHAATATQFAGTFLPRGLGKYAQYGSLALRGAGRSVQASAAAGGSGAAVGTSAGLVALGAVALGTAAALGTVTAAGYKLNEWLDQAVGRYGKFGPQTATERGLVFGEGVQRDIRRAQEMDAVLAKYVRNTFELDQSWEEFKKTLINDLGPILNRLIQVLTGIIDQLAKFSDLYFDFTWEKFGDFLVDQLVQAAEDILFLSNQRELLELLKQWKKEVDQDRKRNQDGRHDKEAEAFLTQFLKMPAALRAAGVPMKRPFPHRRPQGPHRPRRLMPVP
jgi:hypothetical protein